MNKYENNAYFWQKLDTLMLSCNIIITSDKNTPHHKYPNLIFPLDSGYLREDKNDEKKGVPCFVGHNGTECQSVIISVDILSRECAVQLLIGCSAQQEEDVLRFLNQTEFQKTVLIRRGNEIPAWTLTE